MSNATRSRPSRRRVVAALAIAAVLGTSVASVGLLAGTPASATAASDARIAAVATPGQTALASPSPSQPPSSSARAASPATEIEVWVSQSQLPADGTATTRVNAYVTDEDGFGVSGAAVVFSSADPGHAFGTVNDDGDGYYWTTLTATRTLGGATITATVEGTASPVSSTTTLFQVIGRVDSVTVVVQPSTILADGIATTTATATVLDASGHPRSGDELTFGSTDPGHRFGELVDHEDGTYSVVITSSKTVGTSTITFTDPFEAEVGPEFAPAASVTIENPDGSGSVSGSADLLQVLPSAAIPLSAPVPGAGAPTLSATGADVGWLPIGAAAGLVLGAVFLILRRRAARV